MGRRNKRVIRAIRLNELKKLKRKLREEQAEQAGDVAREIPNTDDVQEENPQEEIQSPVPEEPLNPSNNVTVLGSRLRQKKRQNLIEVVEAMKKRKTSKDHGRMTDGLTYSVEQSRQTDGVSNPGGLNDEQLSNIGVFLNRQTNVLQQHLNQNGDGDRGNRSGSTLIPPTTLAIQNEMKKLYGGHLKFNLVRDTILPDRLTGSHALCSLPWQLLVGQSQATGGELGVFSRTYLKVNTVFEPLSGQTIAQEDITKDMNTKFLWPIFNEGGIAPTYLDLSSEETSTWLRYMKPACSKDQQNVEVRVVQNTIFFVTIKTIKPAHELLYWFSPTYCHLQMLLPTPEKLALRIECDKCSLQFDSPLYAQRHINLFHPYGLKTVKYTCYLCKEIIFGRKKLTEHMEGQHGTKAAWQCDECGKAVHSRSYLREHKQKVHQPEEMARKYPCDECKRMFKAKSHLRRHKECVHIRNFDLECEYCNKKFSLKKYLDRHVKAHKGEFPFVCDKCSKGFFDSHSLKVHLLIHSGVKPYQCNLCATSTSTKQLLQIHFKKAHGFTDENMPKIKRQVELTFNSSPIGGYKERDKTPKQRIFRTRPIDKSVDRSGQGVKDGVSALVKEVENIAVNTLLEMYNNHQDNTGLVASSNNSQTNNGDGLHSGSAGESMPASASTDQVLHQETLPCSGPNTNQEIHQERLPVTAPSENQVLHQDTFSRSVSNTNETSHQDKMHNTSTAAFPVQITENTAAAISTETQNSANTETLIVQNTTSSVLPSTHQTSESMQVLNTGFTTQSNIQGISQTTNSANKNTYIVVNNPLSDSEHIYNATQNNNGELLPQPGTTQQANLDPNQPRRDSESGILSHSNVNYNFSNHDFYNSNMGSYHSNTATDSQAFIPSVQNTVENFPQNYQSTDVTYNPSNSQLAPNTIPTSNYTVNQLQWQ